MIEKIKELRVKIDGLAQLVKPLAEQKKYLVDLAYIPHGWTLSKFFEVYRRESVAVVDSSKEAKTEEYIELEKAMKAVQIIYDGSKECSKAYDSLILAKAWLGKILGELGEQTPYQNDGKRKDVKDIEPAADRTYTNYSEKLAEQNLDWSKMSHIEKVDWLRQEIQKLDNNFDALKITPINGVTFVSFKQHLSEARFWLGFELQSIREKSIADK